MWKAAQKGNTIKIHELAAADRAGHDLNGRHPKHGTTPLMEATAKKQGEAVRVLLQWGADPNLVDHTKRKSTALHHAAYYNSVAAILYLVESGANLFAVNNKIHTPLDVARLHRRKDAVDALMRNIDIRSGWLWLRADLVWPSWTRLWCTMIACNREQTMKELLVFKDSSETLPEAILQCTDNEDVRCTVLTMTQKQQQEIKKYGFTLEKPMTLQRPSRGFWRDAATGKTESKVKLRLRNLMFAAADATDQQAWMNALEQVSSSSSTNEEELRQSIAQDSIQQDVDSPAANTISTSITPQVYSHIDAAAPFALGSTPGQPQHEALMYLPSAPMLSEMIEPVASCTTNMDCHCVICLETPSDAICVPCGHLAGCVPCLSSYIHQKSKCPICRAHVASVIKVYHC